MANWTYDEKFRLYHRGLPLPHEILPTKQNLGVILPVTRALDEGGYFDELPSLKDGRSLPEVLHTWNDLNRAQIGKYEIMYNLRGWQENWPEDWHGMGGALSSREQLRNPDSVISHLLMRQIWSEPYAMNLEGEWVDCVSDLFMHYLRTSDLEYCGEFDDFKCQAIVGIWERQVHLFSKPKRRTGIRVADAGKSIAPVDGR